MSNKSTLYIGRAGQMAVMAKFLVRGWNVAVPEVDVGDDLLVLRDSNGDLSRIQVKTASATEQQAGYSTRYSVRLSQLAYLSSPDLTYVFVSRRHSRWESFVIIPRDDLYVEYRSHNVGSLTKSGNISLYFRHTGNNVTCSGQDFSQYLNSWDSWPMIQH